MVVPASKGNGVWATRAGCLSGQSAAVGVGASPLLKNLLTLLHNATLCRGPPAECRIVSRVSAGKPPHQGRGEKLALQRLGRKWRTTGSYLRRTSGAEQPLCQSAAARYRRAEFGRSSEKLTRETEQPSSSEFETLETDQAERLATASPEVAAAVETAAEPQKPARRPLPFLTW